MVVAEVHNRETWRSVCLGVSQESERTMQGLHGDICQAAQTGSVGSHKSPSRTSDQNAEALSSMHAYCSQKHLCLSRTRRSRDVKSPLSWCSCKMQSVLNPREDFGLLCGPVPGDLMLQAEHGKCKGPEAEEDHGHERQLRERQEQE